MTALSLEPLTSLTRDQLDTLHEHLREPRVQRGRPWAKSLRERIVIACIRLRTNLTFRELAAMCEISKSQVHRVVTDIVPRLAALFAHAHRVDRRFTWIVDGTLVPTRDHQTAAKSKNYRWSTNAQVLVRRQDLRVISIRGGGPGNRNDPVHTEDPSSSRSVGRMDAPMGAPVAFRSLSHPPSATIASSAITSGGDTAGGERASNMRSPA